MKEPYTINLSEGQSVIIYHNGKVLIKKTSAECRSIFTAWDSFVGTADEVQAEISRLGLIEVKSPKPTIPTISNRATEPPKGSYVVPPEPVKAGSVIGNAVGAVWDKITSIFGTK